MRIGLIVDRMQVTRWQARLVGALPPETELLIYSCSNSAGAKRRLRHALYYCLNLVSIRNRETRREQIDPDRAVLRTVHFDAAGDGLWEELPADLVDAVERDRPDVLLKLGMGLLRIPAGLRPPILSYHHGDPELFRGRPAGFYELLSGRSVMGQMVQILSNKLDAGEVVAYGETKVHEHSYRATLEEAYRHSPLLIGQALANVRLGRRVEKATAGRNYRLPANPTVARFLGKLATRKVSRLAYGMLREKAWNIASAPADCADLLGRDGSGLPAPDTWDEMSIPSRFGFLADPFPVPGGGGILAEALCRRSQRGVLIHIKDGTVEPLTDSHEHFSYPAVHVEGDETLIVPEMSEVAPQAVFRLEDDRLVSAGELRLPGRPRLLDPTPHRTHDTLYLFGNVADDGPHVLRLWSAADMFAQFEEHPASPICISPAGGRMAGCLFRTDGRLYRLGQDGRRRYGDGIVIFEVLEMTPTSYLERFHRVVRFDDRRGPHTINFDQGRMIFDWYRERLSPLAGARRLRQARLR